MRIATIALLALSGSGCMLTSDGGREIRSDPPGAYVTVEGYGSCETPCTVKLDGPRFIQIAKAGYVTKRYKIQPGAGPVTIPLELAAASEEVDEQTLPDIE